MQTDSLWPGWRTGKLIGEGGFGSVYEIERTLFDSTEKAALKVISIPRSDSELEEMYSDGYDRQSVVRSYARHLKDIVNEYTIMRKMNSCVNIVGCDDVRYEQHPDGIGWDIFIKMELLTPLGKAFPGRVGEKTVIKLGKDICNALIMCKRHGVIHRDIKPQNIFVSENGDFKLGDFGIAKLSEKTMGGTKIGTYKYMAPEVYHDQPYGSAADIYALGLVLYWLLNERRLPFLPMPPAVPGFHDEEQAKSRRFRGERIPVPRYGSKALQAVVLKACAFRPEDRFESAAQMREALEAAERGMPFGWEETEAVRKAEPNTPKKRRSGKTAAIWILAAGLLAAIALLGVVIYNQGKKDRLEATGESVHTKAEAPSDTDPTPTEKPPQSTPASTTPAAPEPTVPPEQEQRPWQVGDYVYFGHYEQDNNLSNGKEEIQWQVLAVEDGRALVISTYALDSVPYHDTYEGVTWEDSTLRAWMNNEFVTGAFTAQERSRIPVVTVAADPNPGYSTNPGNATRDQVFLLSVQEVNAYLPSNAARKCPVTDYLLAQDVYTYGGNYGWWWLRSPGANTGSAAGVNCDGSVSMSGANNQVDGSSYEGFNVARQHAAVRPAMWIEME